LCPYPSIRQFQPDAEDLFKQSALLFQAPLFQHKIPFTMQSKGFSGAGMGFLWDLGSYTTTEFDTDQYRFLLFYSNTNEMKQVVSSIQLTK